MPEILPQNKPEEKKEQEKVNVQESVSKELWFGLGVLAGFAFAVLLVILIKIL